MFSVPESSVTFIHKKINRHKELLENKASNVDIEVREAFKKKKKCGFFPHLLDPPPPKVWKHILGGKKFSSFHLENDLPTHKNWIK